VDTILIKGLRAQARVGVPLAERRRLQKILIDLKLGLDLRKAGREDRVEHTVDYAAVSRDILKIVKSRPFKLVEAMAETIAREILARYAVKEVRIRIRKFSVPQADSVGVKITRP